MGIKISILNGKKKDLRN